MLNEEIRRVGRNAKLYLAGTFISLGITLGGLAYTGHQYSQVNHVRENRPQIINQYHETKNKLTEATKEYKKVVFQFGLTRDSFSEIYRTNSIELSLNAKEFINNYREVESDLEKELAQINRNGFAEANAEYLKNVKSAKVSAGIGGLASLLPLCLAAYCGIVYDNKRKTLDHLKTVNRKKQDEIRKAAREAKEDEMNEEAKAKRRNR